MKLTLLLVCLVAVVVLTEAGKGKPKGPAKGHPKAPAKGHSKGPAKGHPKGPAPKRPATKGWNRNCITKPVGFGSKTTGGQGGRQVTPKDINELRTLLASKEKLIINLDKTYDFTNSEGTTTSSGCFFQKCGAGFQQSLAHAGTCNGRPAKKVTYAKAGTTELLVGSNKSIIGKNGKGAIKGKGLRIKNAQNVILRDFTISDINPQVIWAGDALALENVANVWVHGMTFARVGRQHIVSHQGLNTGITISSCLFDGTSKNSALCDGAHYWLWLFWGTNDQITLINNHVLNTSGRTPHAGGWAKAKSSIHMIGNYMQNNPHTGIEPKSGSNILAEGNLFVNYKNVIDPNAKGGFIAMVNDPAAAAKCTKAFGQPCKANRFQGSKAPARFDASVLAAFGKLDKNAVNSARAASCL